MIPYTLERRSDTGVSNATLGIWLFLASEVMLFGALFSAYALLRVSAESWPSGRDVLNLRIGMINTLVLAVAGSAMWRARTLELARARWAVGVASLLSMLFLALKVYEYTSEISASVRPSTSTFFAMYFALTGLHAVHALGGLIANLWAVAGRAGDAMAAGRIRLISLYWLFVDVAWLAILFLLYLS
jgi:heme/copper-type cytochrome/quinol oxidase subunit 3